MDAAGNVWFCVSGYMNRGTHEGSTGIAYYHYDMGQNALEEKFFIPSSEPYQELKDDLSVLAHRGTNGIFYFYMDHGIYGIDLKSLEYARTIPGRHGRRIPGSGIHRRSRSWTSTPGTRLRWADRVVL